MNIPKIEKDSVNAFNELSATKTALDCLRKTLAEFKNENDVLKSELERIEKENECLKYSVANGNSETQFLKGQVNAYQYALNCRK